MKARFAQTCVMIVAGEASGDQHGAKLVAEMRRLDPTIFFCGIGGKALASAGVRILVDTAVLTVVGITEVFAKLPVVYRSLVLAKKLLQSLKPDLLILIDFPDFNLRVAAAARKLGIPVLYYISPQIWAWRRGRVKKIGKLVSHMAVILPFEADFYSAHGIPVTFVGHPLLDRTSGTGAEADTAEDSAESALIGLLPGSREVEIKRLLPVMLDAAERMHKQDPRLKFAVSVASTVERTMLEAMIIGRGRDGSISLSEKPVERLFGRCRLVVAASGTVTLQAAIAGTPMVIIYKVAPISYWLGRAMIRVEHIGLINLIAGRRLVPELIQDQATAENICDQAFDLLADDERIAQLKQDLLTAGRVLGEAGASRRVAEIALGLMR
ncbi:MAG: lipid-A-disaccharide synthase [Desulfobacterales bacterium]